MIKQIMSALAKNIGGLTNLNLSSNGLATINQGTALANMLETNTTLETLSVSDNATPYSIYNGFEDDDEEYRLCYDAQVEGGIAFIDALSQGDGGALWPGNWLETNQCLQSLDISHNIFVAHTTTKNHPPAHILAGMPVYKPDFSSIVRFFDALQNNK
jgi:hypothetical protein